MPSTYDVVLNMGADHNSAIHLTLLMVVWNLAYLVLPRYIANLSFIYFAIVFGVSVIGIRFFKEVKNPLNWFTKGNLSKTVWIWVAIVSVTSALALILWAFWSDNLGAGQRMVKDLAMVPKPLIFLVLAPFFALLNAFSEEVVYRGVFQEAAERARFPWPAVILLQASGFASAHFLAGFPNGFVGYGMTFVYAVALGILRMKTKGMLICDRYF